MHACVLNAQPRQYQADLPTQYDEDTSINVTLPLSTIIFYYCQYLILFL